MTCEPRRIMDLVTREARLFKNGSGTGTNFSSLSAARENGSRRRRSPPASCPSSRSPTGRPPPSSRRHPRGGRPRCHLDADHPDVEEFIHLEARRGTQGGGHGRRVPGDPNGAVDGIRSLGGRLAGGDGAYDPERNAALGTVLTRPSARACRRSSCARRCGPSSRATTIWWTGSTAPPGTTRPT
jgi:ribonucleoside-diphosphate reductase alpha chain